MTSIDQGSSTLNTQRTIWSRFPQKKSEMKKWREHLSFLFDHFLPHIRRIGKQVKANESTHVVLNVFFSSQSLLLLDLSTVCLPMVEKF